MDPETCKKDPMTSIKDTFLTTPILHQRANPITSTADGNHLDVQSATWRQVD
jgi:hypothetical protein